MEVSCREKVLGLYRNKRKYAQKNKIKKKVKAMCVRVSARVHNNLREIKKAEGLTWEVAL